MAVVRVVLVDVVVVLVGGDKDERGCAYPGENLPPALGRTSKGFS